jgi:hypothetical protein
MMKARNWLEPLTGEPREHEIAAFDTEFCPYHTGDEAFLTGAVAYPDEIVTCSSPADLVSELVSFKNRSSRIYAHNIGVDLANGIRHGLDETYEMKVLSVGYRVLSATIQDENRNQWHLMDSSQVSYYTPVSRIGEMIGFSKDEPDIDWNRCLCDVEPSKKLVNYCKRDSEIVRRWMNNHLQPVVNEFGGQLERTAAGTSMNTWRRSFMDSEETYAVLPEWSRDFIRQSYRGGRTEMFYKGEYPETVYAYDINSLYPSVYGTYDLPDPNSAKGRINPSVGELYDLLNSDCEGFARCTTTSPDAHIPYLKHFNEDLGPQGKLTFPTGTFQDTHSFLELREALKRGYEIQEVEKLVFFMETCNPFQDFTQTLYDLKQQYGDEDPVKYLVVKLLLNSFYGRFGIDATSDDAGYFVFPKTKQKLKEGLFETQHWTNLMANAYDDGKLDWYFEPFSDRPPAYCQPAWASYITAGARHELYEWFEEVDMEVLYCDTDSLYTPQKLPQHCLSSELGAMGKEFEGRVDFHREKAYVKYKDGVISGVKCSGLNVSSLAEDEQTALKKARNALEEGHKVETEQWGSIAKPQAWGVVKDTEKTLGASWTPKRNYNEDGTSNPLHFDQ